MYKDVKSHGILITAEEYIKTHVMNAEQMPQKSQKNTNQFPDTIVRTMLLMLQMKKMLSHNNKRELCEELDSPLKLGNVYQNLAIYNIKYIGLPKIKNCENKLTI